MREIHGQRKRIDALFLKARDLSDDPELLSHWAKYLCVVICGFLENAVELCLLEYCRSRRQPDECVNRYVAAQLKNFQNPKMHKIHEVFRQFSPTWESSLREASEGQIADAVNSIVANRHRIAHGASSDLSLVALRNYYADVLRAVDLMCATCGINAAEDV